MLRRATRTSLILLTAVAFNDAAASPVKRVWLFKTSRLGEYSIRLGVASAFPEAELQIFGELSSQTVEDVLAEVSGPPDLIIHSMSKPEETVTLVELRRRTGATLVVFEDPRFDTKEIDLILSPNHLPPVLTRHGNVHRFEGVPSVVTSERILSADSRFLHLKGPRVVALIGGKTRTLTLSVARAEELGRRLRALANGGSILVTNSRRTPRQSFERLVAHAAPDVVIDVERSGDNPYLELLKAADYLVVTGDSSSMIADALQTGRPVYLFAPRDLVEQRHRRFNLPLLEKGVVRLLGDQLETWEYARPNLRAQIRAEIERVRACRVALINGVDSSE